MKQTLLLLIFFPYFGSFAQDIDALWSDFRGGSSSERVKACDELTRYYQTESKDSLKVLGEELFLFGIDQHYYPAIEQGKLTLANYFISSGKTADGIAMAKALLSNIEERGDDRMMARTCVAISLGYILQKDGKSAYHWSSKGAKYGKNNPDPLVKQEALFALAESYYLRQQVRKAITTYQSYITAIKPYNKYRSMSSAYARLGDIYRIDGNYALAARFFNYSMDYAKKAHRTTPIAHALNNLAIIYFEQGDTAKARNYFERALQLRLKASDAKAVSESYYNLGDYEFYISKNEHALAWYKRSLDVARNSNLKNEQADALQALARVLKSTGDFKGATAFLEQYVELQDEITLRNTQDDEEVAGLQQTIVRLELENDIRNTDGGSTPKGFFEYLRWEWLVIGLLVVALLVLLWYRKTPVSKG